MSDQVYFISREATRGCSMIYWHKSNSRSLFNSQLIKLFFIVNTISYEDFDLYSNNCVTWPSERVPSYCAIYKWKERIYKVSKLLRGLDIEDQNNQPPYAYYSPFLPKNKNAYYSPCPTT